MKRPRRTPKERDLRGLLEFRCAYCGGFKSERPPEWCVRAHEGYDKQQADLRVRIGASR